MSLWNQYLGNLRLVCFRSQLRNSVQSRTLRAASAETICDSDDQISDDNRDICEFAVTFLQMTFDELLNSFNGCWLPFHAMILPHSLHLKIPKAMSLWAIS